MLENIIISLVFSGMFEDESFVIFQVERLNIVYINNEVSFR